VRIIGGDWKRTPLEVIDAPGLRPTPDRVRETLFNWLGQRLDGRSCLDLFAGSGALGLEAASRGASSVLLVERFGPACRAIESVCAKLSARTVRVMHSQALDALAQCAREGRRFDCVFLDPPFGEGWFERLWPKLPAVLAAGAQIYAESESAILETPAGFALERAAQAGQVHYHLFVWIGGGASATGATTREER
jgi:16S rRNA (guanine(966)-N(2))-methyltransferase RsmD